MHLFEFPPNFISGFSQWLTILDRFWDLTEFPEISFVRSSGGTFVLWVNTIVNIVEKGQIHVW